MNNYEAIKEMGFEELEIFLDHVYLTGLNNGMYASRLEGDAMDAILGENPYSSQWMLSEAEEATRYTFAEDGDLLLPDALVQAILRCTGMSEENSDLPNRPG